MTTTHLSPDVAFDADDGLHRFRAATIDQALENARAELGDVEIVEANRIRRGGVGGFFATDLGIELVVRAASARGRDHEVRRDGATPIRDLGRPGGDEYVDSAMPSARPPLTVRDSGPLPTATGARRRDPRDVADESLTAEIERLLTMATATERGRPPAERSFADHLAHHLGDADQGTRPGDRREPPVPATPPPTRPAAEDPAPTARARRRAELARALASDDGVESPEATVERLLRQIVGGADTEPRPADTDHRSMPASDPVIDAVLIEDLVAETTNDTVAETAAREIPAERTGRTPAEAGTEPTAGSMAGDPVTGEPATGTAATSTVSTPVAAETPARPARAAAGRDPWRRSVDLAAGAVGRLVEQLSDVTPLDGSRMRSLSRLTVSVTTPDGAVIELTAELEGDA